MSDLNEVLWDKLERGLAIESKHLFVDIVSGYCFTRFLEAIEPIGSDHKDTKIFIDDVIKKNPYQICNDYFQPKVLDKLFSILYTDPDNYIASYIAKYINVILRSPLSIRNIIIQFQKDTNIMTKLKEIFEKAPRGPIEAELPEDEKKDEIPPEPFIVEGATFDAVVRIISDILSIDEHICDMYTQEFFPLEYVVSHIPQPLLLSYYYVHISKVKSLPDIVFGAISFIGQLDPNNQRYSIMNCMQVIINSINPDVYVELVENHQVPLFQIFVTPYLYSIYLDKVCNLLFIIFQMLNQYSDKCKLVEEVDLQKLLTSIFDHMGNADRLIKQEQERELAKKKEEELQFKKKKGTKRQKEEEEEKPEPPKPAKEDITVTQNHIQAVHEMFLFDPALCAQFGKYFIQLYDTDIFESNFTLRELFVRVVVIIIVNNPDLVHECFNHEKLMGFMISHVESDQPIYSLKFFSVVAQILNAEGNISTLVEHLGEYKDYIAYLMEDENEEIAQLATEINTILESN